MKKYKTEDKDLLTLKIMIVIILISFLICILIEFFPDIFSKCRIFQQHEKFFENIFLGILGSAVITFFVSFLLFKERRYEKENIIKEHLNKVGRKYWNLFLINDVSINEYKIRSDQLQEAAYELMNYCNEFDIYSKKCKELIGICKDTLIPLCIEVKVFSEVLEMEYNNHYLKEIYDYFFKYLIGKFKLEKLNGRFYKFSMICGDIKETIEKDTKDSRELIERIKLEKQYRNIIKEFTDKLKL